MITIIRTRALADLRAEADGRDEALALANDLRDQAEEANRRAAAAESEAEEARKSITWANITIHRQHERIAELTEALQLAKAECGKLREELDGVLREKAAPSPEISREELLNLIVIQVSNSFVKDEWYDLDYDERQKVINAEVARIKAPAAEKLAPVIKAMERTGLIEAGFKVALASDLRDSSPYRSTAWSAVSRLKMARERIYSAEVDLLLLPDACLVYDYTTMPLLGEPVATDIDRYDSKWELR